MGLHASFFVSLIIRNGHMYFFPFIDNKTYNFRCYKLIENVVLLVEVSIMFEILNDSHFLMDDGCLLAEILYCSLTYLNDYFILII